MGWIRKDARDVVRSAYFHSRALRELAALMRWGRIHRHFPDLAHLAFYEQWSWGPVQPDEALLLHALVRTLRPRTLVEIGFLFGHSAFNFLRALDPDARLYSFDIDPASVEVARVRCQHDPRFVLRSRSQDAITPQDIDGRSADFVFLDGAHDLAINQATFARLLPLLSPEATIAIHDTGAIPRSLTPQGHWTLDHPERWAGDDYEHQPDERAFANWLLATHPEFAQIHIHSRRTFRHGMTVLQRSAPLPRPENH
jgi:predicted O-methyltransferase YrrM